MRIFIENYISSHQYEIFLVVTIVLIFRLILFITEKLFKELSEE